MANHADNAQVKSQAKGSTGKKVAIAVVAILGVIVVYCALLVGRVLQAKKHLTQAVSIVQSANIGSDMTSDLSALTGKTAQLQQETKAARSQTDGIVWRIGTVIPYFGDDLSAARTAVTALDTVSNDVIPAVSDSLTNLQKNSAAGNTLDIKSLSSAANAIVKANAAVQTQSKALENAPTPHIGKVRDALSTGKTLFAKLADQSDQICKVVSMFSQLTNGGEGKYLILVQSNAEAQAAGGVPGSVGSLEVKDGKSGWNGELSDDPKQPETGLFVNEMGWSKMDWYAKRNAVVTKTKTNKDGAATWHVKYTIANSMKPEEVQSTPAYITSTFPTSFFEDLISHGSASAEEKTFANTMVGKAQPGVLWHIYVIEPPAGGSVSGIKVSNNSASQVKEGEQFRSIKSDGREYYTNVGVFIDPGCTATVEYDVTTAAGASDLVLDQTPAPYAPQITYEDNTKQ